MRGIDQVGKYLRESVYYFVRSVKVKLLIGRCCFGQALFPILVF